MAEARFDKEGVITNLEELTVEEVASAYSEKNKALFGRMTEAETREAQAKANEAKAKADLEAAQKKPNQGLEEVQGIKESVSKLELSEKKRVFAYENGLSPEETDRVFAINPNPTKETLQDPFVLGGLEAIRAKKKLETNMPGASTGASTFAPDLDLEKATPEEKQAAFDKFREAKGIKG